MMMRISVRIVISFQRCLLMLYCLVLTMESPSFEVRSQDHLKLWTLGKLRHDVRA